MEEYLKSNRRKWLKQISALGAASILTTPLFSNFGAYNKDIKTEFIKLSSNENPYGPSKKAQQAILNNMGITNRYPFDLTHDLEDELTTKNGLDMGMVLLGAGSSELLQTLGHWIVSNALRLTYSTPTFEILPNYVKRLKGQVDSVNMTSQFEYDLEKLLVNSSRNPGVVYLVNPNNPTGTKIPKSELLAFLKEVTKHSYLILDEAYIEYVSDSESLVTEIELNPKLIVLRTFSKIYGLAGLRVGYLLGHPSLINELKDISIWGSHSLNVEGIMAARVSLNDQQFIEESRSNNEEIKKTTISTLKEVGIIPYQSSTNFIFFPIPNNDDLRAILALEKISIGQIKIKETNYARVTIGTSHEMKILIKHISKIYT